jgi:hypothetical protein
MRPCVEFRPEGFSLFLGGIARAAEPSKVCRIKLVANHLFDLFAPCLFSLLLRPAVIAVAKQCQKVAENFALSRMIRTLQGLDEPAPLLDRIPEVESRQMPKVAIAGRGGLTLVISHPAGERGESLGQVSRRHSA